MIITIIFGVAVFFLAAVIVTPVHPYDRWCSDQEQEKAIKEMQR